jgi:isopenicillin-N epimerase
MLPLDLRAIDADYYTANHHKWLCAPKSSGFLYVRPEFQAEVRPTVISHAANRPRPGRTRFLAEFDWTGTFDPTPLLALPAAIAFLSSLYPSGINELMSSNRDLALRARERLCDALQVDVPSPKNMIGSLVSIILPKDLSADDLGSKLYQQHQIEVPVFRGPPGNIPILRFSVQAYNHIEQIDRLVQALIRESRAGR